MKQVDIIFGCPFTLFSPNWASVTEDSAFPLLTPGKMARGAENPIH